MAEVVNEMPKPRTRQRTSEWEPFLDGQIWKLAPGTDFKGEVETARSAAITVARRRGLYLRTRIDGDGNLYLQSQKEPIRASEGGESGE